MSRQYLRIEDALNMIERWPINVYHAPIGIFYETWGEQQFTTFIQKWSVELSGPIATARGLCLYSADLDANRKYFFQTTFPTRVEVVEAVGRLSARREDFEEWAHQGEWIDRITAEVVAPPEGVELSELDRFLHELAAEAGLSFGATRRRFCHNFSPDPELEAAIERMEAKARPGAGSLVLGGQGPQPRSGDAVLGGN
jgi:hypothetical protein